MIGYSTLGYYKLFFKKLLLFKKYSTLNYYQLF